MKILIDNDAVLKLSAFKLLDHAIRLTGGETCETLVLDSAKYYIRRKQDKLRHKYTASGVESALKFVEQCSSIEAAPDSIVFSTLNAIENIDPGEAILFATAHTDTDACILTGDKRSLVAVASNDGAKPTYASLKSRVVCLESILIGLIIHLGFDEVKTQIIAVHDCDTAIRAAFGSGVDATEIRVLETLRAYQSDLEKKVGEGWLRSF